MIPISGSKRSRAEHALAFAAEESGRTLARFSAERAWESDRDTLAAILNRKDRVPYSS